MLTFFTLYSRKAKMKVPAFQVFINDVRDKRAPIAILLLIALFPYIFQFKPCPENGEWLKLPIFLYTRYVHSASPPDHRVSLEAPTPPAP